MTRALVLAVVLAGCGRADAPAPTPAPAPGMPPQPPQQQPDPLAPYLIPPEAVMQHQSAIGLTPDQQHQLVAAIQGTQAEMVDLQWKLVQARDALVATLAGETVDEAQVLERADALFALERDTKRKQLTLVVRVRNTLTPAQRARLRDLLAGKP